MNNHCLNEYKRQKKIKHVPNSKERPKAEAFHGRTRSRKIFGSDV